MKRRILSLTPIMILAALLCVVAVVFADGGWSKSSGVLNASKAIVSKPAGLCAITIGTGGSGASNITVNLHDGTSTSGVSLFSMTVPAADYTGGRVFIPPIQFFNGIYGAISGSTGTFIIEYLEQR